MIWETVSGSLHIYLESQISDNPALVIYSLALLSASMPGWGSAHVQGFGEEAGAKTQIFNLIRSIKTTPNSDEYLYHPLQTYIWLKFSFINFIIKEFRVIFLESRERQLLKAPSFDINILKSNIWLDMMHHVQTGTYLIIISKNCSTYEKLRFYKTLKSFTGNFKNGT
ncbi:hypothetical protein Avbf_12041 [Armadillidium vulgare]|nr:hypothetical protein Avbf_12041 [Armadillidium vulgare]